MDRTGHGRVSSAADRAGDMRHNKEYGGSSLMSGTNEATLVTQDSACDESSGNAVRPDTFARTYAITMSFYNLPTDGKIEVLTYQFSDCRWVIKDPVSGVVWMILEAPQTEMLPVRDFALNGRRLNFNIFNGCAELRLLLFLSARDNLLQGFSDLPAGSWMSLESENDKTNVMGRGSFALMLGERS